MDADDLLQALAAQERERLQARPAEWDELAHGRMAPDDAVAAVQARGSVDEQELARARELFTPPSPELDEALVDRLVALATTREPLPASGEKPVNGHAVIHAEQRWWRHRMAMVGAGVMAAAAAVLVFTWPRGSTDVDGPRVQLPRHEIWIESAAEVRGSEAVKALAPGSAFTVYLRPDRGYSQTPSVAACLRKGDATRVLDVTPSKAAAGTTMDVVTHVPDDVDPGRYEVVALIAGGQLPQDIAASCASPPTDVQVSRTAIEITSSR